MAVYVLNIADGNRFYYFSTFSALKETAVAYIYNFYSNHDKNNFAFYNTLNSVVEAMTGSFEIEGLISWTTEIISENSIIDIR